MIPRAEFEAILVEYLKKTETPSIESLFDIQIIEVLLDIRDLQQTMNRRLSRLGSTSTQ